MEKYNEMLKVQFTTRIPEVFRIILKEVAKESRHNIEYLIETALIKFFEEDYPEIWERQSGESHTA